ncbi:DNA-methyltransferase [Fructilactobacillus lindneri]|nr:site-specific DNA-methyltransferase [Fructilactobacillus lindneri]SKA07868.1 DNA modification methylase [Fructilactobacillus lindneri DSM 20690 = JCM 11027]
MSVKLLQGDCLELMKGIPDKSIDMILCDLPYGTTANKWDKILPAEILWGQYLRIIKPKGAIVLFTSGQFTNKLINSQNDIYRYKWVWEKNRRGNFVNAKNRPMTSYEEICVFSKGITANTKNTDLKMNYYPQGLIEINKIKKHSDTQFGTMAGKRPSHKKVTVQKYTNYPSDILKFDCVSKPEHPTQKPLELLEYLIRTYTRENETVLDNTMGSGSTGVACVNTNRNFIGMELDENYFKIAKERIERIKSKRDL